MANYDPDMTLIEREDKRRKPYSNHKVATPAIQWSVIITLAMSIVTGTTFAIRLEGGQNRNSDAIKSTHDTAMTAIENERALRIVTASNTTEDVAEIKQEIKEVKDEVKESALETQRLLRELLQQQNND